jgi:hypothetical protein
VKNVKNQRRKTCLDCINNKSHWYLTNIQTYIHTYVHRSPERVVRTKNIRTKTNRKNAQTKIVQTKIFRTKFVWTKIVRTKIFRTKIVRTKIVRTKNHEFAEGGQFVAILNRILGRTSLKLCFDLSNPFQLLQVSPSKHCI